jgi:hypothetical protein
MTSILKDNKTNIYWNLRHATKNREKVEDLSLRLQSLYDSFVADAFHRIRSQTEALAAENARLQEILAQWMAEDERARRQDFNELVDLLNEQTPNDVAELADADNDVNAAVQTVIIEQNPEVKAAVRRRRPSFP